MAISYVAFNNTPCSISRGVSASVGDLGASLRVGAKGCPLPTNWGIGTPENPVFFDKLKAAARRLTGSQTDAELSGLNIVFEFFQWQAGIAAIPPAPSWDDILHLYYPDGRLLEAPLFESVTSMSGTYGTFSSRFGVTLVTFENTGGAAAPRYADFALTYDTNEANIHISAMIKLFHSLTT